MPFAMRRLRRTLGQVRIIRIAGVDSGGGLRRTICITGVVARRRTRAIAAAGTTMCGMMPTATLIIMAQLSLLLRPW